MLAGLSEILSIALPVGFGLLTLFLIAFLTPIAARLKLIDAPSERKHHGALVPTVGGIAIYTTLIVANLYFDLPEKVSWLIYSGGILVILGGLDDAFSLGVRFRLIVQIGATCVMMYGTGLWITSIGITSDTLAPVLMVLGPPFTIFCVVGLVNALNMMDGIDGLAAGQTLISIVLLITFVFVQNGEVYRLDWVILLCTSVFSFLIVNLSLTPLQKVFLGDAGSLLLGFILAWTLIYFSQAPVGLVDPAIVLWCVTIPAFDALCVASYRHKNRISPFESGRHHLHHIFLAHGLSSVGTLLVISILSLTFGFFGLFLSLIFSDLVVVIAWFICLFIYFSIFYLRRFEFSSANKKAESKPKL